MLRCSKSLNCLLLCCKDLDGYTSPVEPFNRQMSKTNKDALETETPGLVLVQFNLMISLVRLSIFQEVLGLVLSQNIGILENSLRSSHVLVKTKGMRLSVPSSSPSTFYYQKDSVFD